MHSPEREGSLLVPAHAVPVDGCGTRYGIQMVGAIGQGGHPLTVPLCLLFPGKTWEIPYSICKPNTPPRYQVVVSGRPEPGLHSRPQWELLCTADSAGSIP